jgi:mRNA interferase RelE/StbE
MAWRIDLDRVALRELDRLDPQVSKRILAVLHGRLAKLSDPRSIGESLRGSKLGDLWRYRVGDYRIVADIDDGAVRILVVRIGHRRGFYR